MLKTVEICQPSHLYVHQHLPHLQMWQSSFKHVRNIGNCSAIIE